VHKPQPEPAPARTTQTPRPHAQPCIGFLSNHRPAAVGIEKTGRKCTGGTASSGEAAHARTACAPLACRDAHCCPLACSFFTCGRCQAASQHTSACKWPAQQARTLQVPETAAHTGHKQTASALPQGVPGSWPPLSTPAGWRIGGNTTGHAEPLLRVRRAKWAHRAPSSRAGKGG